MINKGGYFMDGESRKLIDVIRWGQDYVEGKDQDGSLKQRIEKAVTSMSDFYISLVIDSINRAVKEDMEEAIYYSPERDIYRVFELKEITQEEYDNNPVKLAHDEYAGAIKHRVGDLDLISVLEAITATKNIPTYKNAT